jgi:hypothetical protein
MKILPYGNEIAQGNDEIYRNEIGQGKDERFCHTKMK